VDGVRFGPEREEHVLQILAALATAALVAFGQAGPKPNFSGEWKMNPAKSSFGGMPAPDVLTRSIAHDEPALTIVEVQQSPLTDQKATRKYVTDGTPTTFESTGATVNSSAKWDGPVLVVISQVEAAGLGFNDRMSLSADGKSLTSVVRISSPQGEVEFTVVFDKQ
jgi:hypothetical protein